MCVGRYVHTTQDFYRRSYLFPPWLPFGFKKRSESEWHMLTYIYCEGSLNLFPVSEWWNDVLIVLWFQLSYSCSIFPPLSLKQSNLFHRFLWAGIWSKGKYCLYFGSKMRYPFPSRFALSVVFVPCSWNGKYFRYVCYTSMEFSLKTLGLYTWQSFLVQTCKKGWGEW